MLMLHDNCWAQSMIPSRRMPNTGILRTVRFFAHFKIALKSHRQCGVSCMMSMGHQQ